MGKPSKDTANVPDSRIDFSDVLIGAGLSCLGAGLFSLYGLPVALVVVGAILLIIGLYAAGYGARPQTKEEN